MAIMRWDPFRELATLQGQMNRLFQDVAPGRTGSGNRGEEFMTTGTFIPAVDIYEDEHNITLKLEVPGINENDIDVRLQDNTLVVRGERKFENEEKEENFHRIERSYGSFQRSFTLPQTVDTNNVSADYNNGVLQIRLAKRAETKPKQVKVNAGTQQSKTIEAGKGGSKAA
jgi:HSP20 family protein